MEGNSLTVYCNIFLESYDIIGVKYDENIPKMNEVIDFYNANIMLIALNNLAPCYIVDVYTVDTYRFAYAAIYMAAANIRARQHPQ